MAASDSSSSEPKVQIVYTERPENQDPEEYHIKTLASIFCSEEALLYSYKHAASGFSAKLTPEQVSQLSRFPQNNQGCFKLSPVRHSSFILGRGN